MVLCLIEMVLQEKDAATGADRRGHTMELQRSVQRLPESASPVAPTMLLPGSSLPNAAQIHRR